MKHNFFYTLLALLLAPLIPMLLIGVLLSFPGFLDLVGSKGLTVGSVWGVVNLLSFTLVIGSLFAYPIAFLLFLPQHYLLRWLDLKSYGFYSLIGAIAGLAATLYFALNSSKPFTFGDISFMFPWLGVPSIIGALAFRFILGYFTKLSASKKRKAFEAEDRAFIRYFE